MSFTASDIVPFTQARANLSELAEQVKAGAEKIITKNGESYVALIDSDRLDYYHRLERERIHLLLIDDARRGLVAWQMSRQVASRRRTSPLPACRNAVLRRRSRWSGQESVAKSAHRVELSASFLERLESIEAFLRRVHSRQIPSPARPDLARRALGSSRRRTTSHLGQSATECA